MQHQATTTPSRPRLVLFDLDNTLCDHRASLLIRLDHAFRMAFPDDDVRARIVQASVEIATDGTEHFEHLVSDAGAIDPDPDVLDVVRDRYRSDRFQGLELYDDVLEGIEAVARRFEIGMITNGPTGIQQPKIDLLEIESLFSFVLISESTGFWKPDPRIFELALDRAGVPAHQAVYVGDSPDHDIAGAKLAGLKAVWMNRRGIAWPGGGLPDPDHETRNMRELLEWLGVELG
ncbi:HAD family hydrolase [soil metagenome]